jgi:glycolate oxidase FAD binding subunit
VESGSLSVPQALPAQRPSTLEELAEAVRGAGRAQARVRVSGSGSSPLTVFPHDARPVQDISTLRIGKLLEHAVGDMTVIVQAGMTLEALQKALAWRNQWLPVDPPVAAYAGGSSTHVSLRSTQVSGGATQVSGGATRVSVGATNVSGGAPRTPGTRTIGGMIASNALGPLRFGCGDWRLFILGMRFVDACGRIIKGGGRTVKNVAGYSTPRMMIGSCGSLGVIAEVTLRTFSRPEDEQCTLFFCPDAAHAEELLAALFVAPTRPAWIQAAGARTFACNPLQLPAPAEGIVLGAGFLGQSAACEAQVAAVRALTAARGMEALTLGAVPSGRLRQWMAAEPAVHGAAGFRLFARSSAVAGMIARLEAAGANWVVSEAGNGVIRGTVPEDARDAITAWAGESRILWTQGRVPAGASADALYQRLKRGLDPDQVYGDCPA